MGAEARTGLAADSVRRLHETLSRLHAPVDLSRSLQETCAALHDLLGSATVTLSLASGDLMSIVAVAGPDGERWRGTAVTRQSVEAFLDRAVMCGLLRVCRNPVELIHELEFTGPGGAPDLSDCEVDPDSVLLIAPMVMDSAGLVGLLTLDVVKSLVDDELTCTVLEMFTLQAGVAIHQHRLARQLEADTLALRLSEERFRLAFDDAPIGMVELSHAADELLVVERVNRAASRMFGVDPMAGQGRQVDDILAVADEEPLSAHLLRLLGGKRLEERLELRLVRSDGATMWGLVRSAVLPDVSGRRGVLCQIVDITQSKADELELTKLAHHDPLTGLPNRWVLLQRLAQVVDESRRTGERGAVLFCDLDNFKVINDEHGHLTGDDVLTELSGRLGGVVRKGDIVGRLGGDEFLVVAYPVSDAEAMRLAERIQGVLSDPLVRDGRSMQVGVSVGIATITGHLDATDVLRLADAAMYQARGQGVGRASATA